MDLFIDMDDVLCGFESHCREVFGRRLKDGEDLRDFKAKIGHTAFWKAIRETKGFWESMPPNAPDIIDVWNKLCDKANKIHILSSPTTRDPECIIGKNKWLDEHLPTDVPYERIFEKKKEKYAHPNALLIDDTPNHIWEWRAAGGKAILFKGSFDQEFWDELDTLLHSK